MRCSTPATPTTTANADRSGDVIEQLEKVTERFRRAPEMIGLFTVLLTENLDPDAPLHERFLGRYRAAVAIVADVHPAGAARGPVPRRP